MKVRMRTIYAGPAGTARPGAVIELELAEAEALIASGYASAAPVDEVPESADSAGGATEEGAEGGPGAPLDETTSVEPPEAAVTRTARPDAGATPRPRPRGR